jgi:pimeloyl-ACP methyl ester carboxylesterase
MMVLTLSVVIVLSSCRGDAPSVDRQSAVPRDVISDVASTVEPTRMATRTPTALTGGSSATAHPVDWQECALPLQRPDVDCAYIRVPLDYTQPPGEQITLTMMRYAAQAPRRGAIFVNPGGPGSSAIAYLHAMGPTYIERYGLQHYDLIAFDPRGVGYSGGLKCQSDAEIDTYLYPDYTPDTAGEVAFLVEADRAFINACRDVYPNRLHHFSTVNTAHDLDRIRQSIGDEQIGYVGVSYGSYLGAVYASMYPMHVRVMVLDSAFAPDGDTLSQYYVTQAAGFERAFQRWIAWCQSTVRCQFTADDVGARWDSLIATFDANPQYARDGRITNHAVITIATVAALYSQQTWDTLGRALFDAEQGNLEAVWLLADMYYGRGADGQFDSSIHAFPIISCASGFGAPAVPNPQPILNLLRQVAPRLGRDVSFEDIRTGDRCVEYMESTMVAPIAYGQQAPILIIGGLYDPATPIRWAYEMRAAMGDTASLVIYTGEGHGHLFESRCVDYLVEQLLVDEILPYDGTQCAPDTPVAPPSWWMRIPAPLSHEQPIDSTDLAVLIGLSPLDYHMTAYQTTGTTAQLLQQYDGRLAHAGFVGWRQPVLLNDAAYKYYFSNDGIVGLYVFGSDTLAKPQWALVRSRLATSDAALVVFFYKP